MFSFITTNTLFYDYLIGVGLSTLLYILYLELSPGLGNIVFRINSEGVRSINIGSFIQFLKYPFKEYHFWKPQFWDINYYIFSNVGAIAYMICKNSNTIHNLILDGYVVSDNHMKI